MRTIKIKVQVDDVDMIITQFTEEEYALIKEKTGADPLILVLNKIRDILDKHIASENKL